MTRVPTVRQADLDRALRALKAQGLGVARIEVRPGGVVVILPGPLANSPPATSAPATSTDGGPALTDDPLAGDISDLDRFRAEKHRRGLHASQGS